MRHATPEQLADYLHDQRKHSMTNREIIAELDRVEREIREAVARSQAASKQAMDAIEDLMDQLGVQLSKSSAQ